ncbi:MAG: carboxypeptidase-like regulatory domain-containing protein [Candidatus Bathyarchaeia archaeon]
MGGKIKAAATIIFLFTAMYLISSVHSAEVELFLDDEKEMTISGRSLILTSDIVVKNKSSLIIANSNIQLSVRGERGYNLLALDSGRVMLSSSTLQSLFNASTIEISGRANMTILNSTITGFNTLTSRENSTLHIHNSRLLIPYINCSCRALTLTGGNMPKGELKINTSTVSLERFKADRIHLDVGNSILKNIQANNLAAKSSGTLQLNSSRIGNCTLQSNVKVVIADSTFDWLKFLSSGDAVNVTVSKGRAGGPIYADTNVTVQRYWYLRVNVTDLAGTGIPAKIVVEDYFGKTVTTGEADARGLYSKPILAEVVNGSKTIFLGNFRVRAEYFNYTTRTVPIVLDGNRYVELRFMDSVPLESATKLVVSPVIVRVGDPVRVSGWVDSKMSGEHVEVIVIGPNNTRIDRVYRTIEGGFFEGEFKPNIDGRWIVYADWISGPPQATNTRSRAYTVLVEPRPPLIILIIRALPIVVVVIGICVAAAFLLLSRFRESRTLQIP